MIPEEILAEIVEQANTKIVFFIIDGLGGVPFPQKNATELEYASTPNLDALASRSLTGLVDPISPGITPGSGAGHLAIFGYDPFKYQIGRGVLSALGVDFELRENDIAARLNFATADPEGVIIDRRAGRISDEENAKLCQIVLREVKLSAPDAEYFLLTEKEHRAVFILRAKGLGDKVNDTDPQIVGKKLIKPEGADEPSQRTASLLWEFLQKSHEVLKKTGSRANIFLSRGVAKYVGLPSFYQRYKLKALAIAEYPMYRGLARLVGMDVEEKPTSLSDAVKLLKKNYDKYDFFYLHYKKPDSRGEDGDFEGKVKAIEEADSVVPELVALNPDVLVVTGDHSTPCLLKAHSWHPCPLLVNSKSTPGGVISRFDEKNCLKGELGIIKGVDLIPLVLANSQRLTKFGA